MRICSVSIVRNEADIIETFVRHNLGVLDGMVLIDHGSCDGTSDILAALVGEGLPLTVLPDERLAFLQPEMVTPAARRALQQGADRVFVLDADEFVKTPSRESLERMLARVPDGIHALAEWLTYVPAFARDAADVTALVRSARRVPEERHKARKVIVGRQFLDAPAAFVGMGNHRVYPSTTTPEAPCPHAVLPKEAVAIAHVPVRSADQLTVKIAVGWLAHVAARRGNPELAYHWREAYARLASGERFTAATLAEMAANYSVPRARWIALQPADLIDDPFLAPLDLRYAHLRAPDALTVVLRFAERLANGR